VCTVVIQKYKIGKYNFQVLPISVAESQHGAGSGQNNCCGSGSYLLGNRPKLFKHMVRTAFLNEKIDVRQIIN
jgi:hypothetical protein